jgi:hypothetical protein
MKLPEGYTLCPLCNTASRSITCPRCVTIATPAPVIAPAPCRDTVKGAKRREGAVPGPRGPNKTELEYRRRFIDGEVGPGVADETIVRVDYEGLTFRLAAGFRYTPDWVVQLANGQIEAHEAKGPWQSRDAHIRWAQAAQEWPTVRFFWGKRDKNGEWKTEERNT